MDYLWSVGVMEYWVRAIFLERKFTIKSVIPGDPGIRDFPFWTGMTANHPIIC